jgi:hypothetical protein
VTLIEGIIPVVGGPGEKEGVAVLGEAIFPAMRYIVGRTQSCPTAKSNPAQAGVPELAEVLNSGRE